MENLRQRKAMIWFRAGSDLPRAVEATARHRGQTMSEFVSQSVRAQPARHGVRHSPDGGPRTPPAVPALRKAA